MNYFHIFLSLRSSPSLAYSSLAKIEDFNPDKAGVDGLEKLETLRILQFPDRLEEVKENFLKR